MKEHTQAGGKSPVWKRFLRAVSRDGFLNAARKGVWHCRTAVRNFRKRHTPAIVKEYRALAAKKGSRLARQELLGRMREKLLRPLRKMAVKRQMKKGGASPLVSFILPVYNVEPYLEQALDSLLCQTLKHIEIICVDDGSTDSSLEILNRYVEKDSRVRVFTQKNQYAGVARNHGLSKATGEYVCFVDPDDFFEPDLAQTVYYAAKADRADAVIYGANHYHNETGEYDDGHALLFSKRIPSVRPFNRDDCPDTLYQISTPVLWTKLFRRQFVLDHQLQFQAIRNTNDVLFTMSALALAERIVAVDRQLVHYRIGMSTNLQATKSKDPLCFYEAYAALHNRLKELGLLEQLRKSYVNAVSSSCIYNWLSLKDPQARLTVEKFLREQGFRELELTGYDRKYYYIQRHYRLMQGILNDTAEAALQAEQYKS